MRATIDGVEYECTKVAPVQEKKPFKRWRAEEGEKYFTIIYGYVENIDDDMCKIDDGNYNTGNYYQTEELAQAALDKQLAIVRVNDTIDELNGLTQQISYFTLFHNGVFKYESNDYAMYHNVIHVIYTEAIAQQIIKQHQEDLKIIFDID